MKQINIQNEEQTKEFAKHFAKVLDEQNIKSAIILLDGTLGAGKTKFTTYFLSYFNLDDEVSSPTFNIVNVYENDNVLVNHFDVYRLSSYDELLAIGVDEYFLDGINIIEWSSIIEDGLDYPYIKISITKDEKDENLRIFNISQNPNLKNTTYERIIDLL